MFVPPLVLEIIIGILLIAVLVLFLLLLRLKRNYHRFMKGLGETDVEKVMQQYADGLEQLKDHVRTKTEGRIDLLEQKMPTTLRHVGMVCYNAFENMGNLMSFSVAALDDEKNGFVLTGIYSRDSSYVYAKDIKEGVPGKELSKEEKEALSKAMENGRT